MPADFNIALLHENMLDKTGKLVTTSLTLIDVHDIARSSRTFGVNTTYIAHPSSALRKLSRTLQRHWDSGFGAAYNPDRKEALDVIDVVSNLDEAIQKIDLRSGQLPKIIATSAKEGEDRVSFEELRETLQDDQSPYLMLFGTGWGMSDELMSKADIVLEPIKGSSDYNHLSVRSACAIILSRLFGS